jgi:RNA polymerase sigma-32 factor
MTVALLPKSGSFRSYLTYIYSIPNCSLEEEQELARRFRDNGDLDAARQLVLSHMKFVVSIARGYEGYGLPLEDVVQEGTVGLMKAVKKFDPDRGVRLVTLAITWIKAQIQEYVIKNWRLVKIATTHEQRKLFFNLRSLKKELAPLQTDQVAEIAKQLNVSKKDVIEMEYRFSSGEVSISTSEDEEDQVSYIKHIPEDSALQPENIVAESQYEELRLNAMKMAFEKLDSRSQLIIKSRYLCDAENVRTLHDLAGELKISHERVRQLEAAALKKMKDMINV